MKKAALAQAIDEAWAMIALVTFAAIATLLFVRSRSGAAHFGGGDRRRNLKSASRATQSGVSHEEDRSGR